MRGKGGEEQEKVRLCTIRNTRTAEHSSSSLDSRGHNQKQHCGQNRKETRRGGKYERKEQSKT